MAAKCTALYIWILDVSLVKVIFPVKTFAFIAIGTVSKPKPKS